MKGLRILLVDDEPLMRLSMVDALEAIGHDVEAAASGTEGIEAIRQRPIYACPARTGLRCSERPRNRRPLPKSL
jgi:CheY-like chemotaxis protein